jgi:septum formation protein
MNRIVLASQSSARRRMLAAAGVRFDCKVAAIDEASVIEALVAERAPGRNIADCLAELKALRVSQADSDAWVIGADQVLSCGGEIFQKPGSRGGAAHQLVSLRGKVHVLHSAVCVARNGKVLWRHVGEARMHMRAFSDDFLDAYLVEAGEDILGSVGAYHVEGVGIQLFSKIDGDIFTVQGLPLLALLDFLRLHQLLRS